jgi:hypothetical protein
VSTAGWLTTSQPNKARFFRSAFVRLLAASTMACFPSSQAVPRNVISTAGYIDPSSPTSSKHHHSSTCDNTSPPAMSSSSANKKYVHRDMICYFSMSAGYLLLLFILIVLLRHSFAYTSSIPKYLSFTLSKKQL